MYIQKRASKKSKVNASARTRKQNIKAEDEIIEDVVDEAPVEEGVAEVDPEATDLLFEAEDVAELVAEVTGEEVAVEIADDGEAVVFTVGEDEFTVEPEGEEEILESSRKVLRGKKAVRASKRVAAPKRGRRVRK